MTVFAVIAPSPSEPLEKAVRENYPERWYPIAPGQFLVSADRVTSKQVMDKLGLPGGTLGRAVVIPMTSYSGWHAKDIWEWIAAQNAPPAKADPEPSDDDDE